MVTESDTTAADNVRPFPGAAPEAEPRSGTKTRSRDRTGAARQAKYRSRNKGNRYTKAAKDPSPPPLADAPPIAPTVTQAPRNGVTPPSRETWPKSRNTPAPKQADVRQPRYASVPLVVIAYGFFALGIAINVWNAMNGGALADVALPAAMGVLAEGVMFFLPAWAIRLPWGRQAAAWALLVFVSAFALTNSLRMASIVAADQAMARAERETAGVTQAGHALDVARAQRDGACGRGLGKTVACRERQAEVAKLEERSRLATVAVASQAKPESTDFAGLVSWVSLGTLHPGSRDFDMLWLLFRTFLPQVGGLVLMLASRGREA